MPGHYHKRFSKSGRRANRSRTGTALIVIVVAFFAVFSALPLILMISQAFKPAGELYLYPPKLFPQNPTLGNFKTLFDVMSNSWVPFSRYLFNTLLIAVAGTLGNILVSSMAAYPLAKSRAPFVGFLFGMVTLALMFTQLVNDIANYMTMSALGWIDTYAALIVPGMATSFSLFLMRQFMIQIPDDLLSAARIDGAGEYAIFFRIVMPNVKPAWLTMALFSFQGLWSVGSTPYIYREEMKTMTYALNQIVSGGLARIGAGAAVTLLMMTVPILFFILTQSQIMETMTASGIKE
jgi:ABC transporter, permease protein